ncbi:MAG: hypothetical protein AAF533_13510 [Acidobacteriota bacterium]
MDEPKQGSLRPVTAVALAGTVVLLWTASLVFVPKIMGQPEGAGTFGDMFGAVNALFSGLAFAGLIYTILLQRQELEFQRLELGATRAEFARQTEQFEQQSESMKQSSQHEVLVDTLTRYSTPEMLNAVRALWRFHRQHLVDLVPAYMTRLDQDDERIENEAGLDPIELERTTLHYKRRLVSKFFVLLSGLREIGALPDDLLYAYFPEQDLRIIPDVLSPIDRALAERYGQDGEVPPDILRMERLHSDSPAARS